MVSLQLNCASAVTLWKYYLMEVSVKENTDARPIFFLYTAEQLVKRKKRPHCFEMIER